MLSTPTDLLAAGFAVAGFVVFMFVCANVIETGEKESNSEIALNLSRGFTTLSAHSTEDSIEWLKNQKEFLESLGIKVKLEIVNSSGEILFVIGEGNPKNYSKIVLFCTWPERGFQQNSVLTCYVWRE